MKFFIRVIPWLRLAAAATRLTINRWIMQTRQRVFLQYSLLAGYQYHEAGTLWHRLRPGA